MLGDYAKAVIENNIERLDDIVYDADALLDNCNDPGLHGMILGIKAVAQNSAGSLRALVTAETVGESQNEAT